MKVFVTGATGFIGKRLAEKLLRRGDAVTCLVRNPARAASLAQLGARLAEGDVTDRASVRAAMAGAEAVFHVAGVYELGHAYAQLCSDVNVEGTRNTLETAAELGVPRIVHTSTVGVFGNTHGLVVEESYRVPRAELASVYERTKWEAHYTVAAPLQKQGAPVMITLPGFVTGPGDQSPHALMFGYFFRRFPMMFGAHSGLTLAHLDDIADGHLLALDRGRPGESYILAGPPVTYRQVFQTLEDVTGMHSPRLWAPDALAGWTARLVRPLETRGMSLPWSYEVLRTLDHYTFWASADKAKRELGWRPRPLAETLRSVAAGELAPKPKAGETRI